MVKFEFDDKGFKILQKLTCRTSTYSTTIAEALALLEIVEKYRREDYSGLHVVNPIDESYKEIIFPE